MLNSLKHDELHMKFTGNIQFIKLLSCLSYLCMWLINQKNLSSDVFLDTPKPFERCRDTGYMQNPNTRVGFCRYLYVQGSGKVTELSVATLSYDNFSSSFFGIMLSKGVTLLEASMVSLNNVKEFCKQSRTITRDI